jgi:polyhydroxyalkanoate synthesis regulator phasin
MLGEIKRGLLAGFGAVFLTKEKIEEVTRKLVAEAKLSREDAERLRKELLDTGEEQWKEMEQSVSGAVRKAVESLNISPRGDVEELKVKVDALDKRLQSLEEAAYKSRES